MAERNQAEDGAWRILEFIACITFVVAICILAHFTGGRAVLAAVSFGGIIYALHLQARVAQTCLVSLSLFVLALSNGHIFTRQGGAMGPVISLVCIVLGLALFLWGQEYEALSSNMIADSRLHHTEGGYWGGIRRRNRIRRRIGAALVALSTLWLLWQIVPSVVIVAR